MMQHPTLDEREKVPDSSAARLAEAARLVREAAWRGCDFLCLPELFADPSQGLKMREFAEPVGGPVMTWLARMAAKHRMALVTSVAIRRGRRVANTGVIFDKRGRLVGRYEKVHLPDGEREVGTPGRQFPAFKVACLPCRARHRQEGVRVGMQICHDLNFPEGCRILALKGADIVVWPNMWGGMPEEHTEVIMKARAIDNKLCLVSSAYLLTGSGFFRVPKIHGRTCIIDWTGTVVAETGRRLGVAVAALDLDELHANRLSREKAFQRERLPRLYGELAG